MTERRNPASHRGRRVESYWRGAGLLSCGVVAVMAIASAFVPRAMAEGDAACDTELTGTYEGTWRTSTSRDEFPIRLILKTVGRSVTNVIDHDGEEYKWTGAWTQPDCDTVEVRARGFRRVETYAVTLNEDDTIHLEGPYSFNGQEGYGVIVLDLTSRSVED